MGLNQWRGIGSSWTWHQDQLQVKSGRDVGRQSSPASDQSSRTAIVKIAKIKKDHTWARRQGVHREQYRGSPIPVVACLVGTIEGRSSVIEIVEPSMAEWRNWYANSERNAVYFELIKNPECLLKARACISAAPVIRTGCIFLNAGPVSISMSSGSGPAATGQTRDLGGWVPP